MKIIVGGAGNVGKSIVAYLSRGDNDIVVIDNDEESLEEVERQWDVLPMLGSVSHPDILKKAGASKADLLIAATGSDEVNMIACQVAHSIFNIPRKVARISARIYLKAAWGNLFGDRDVPVDLAFSPEYEIAQTIKRVLKYPGMSGIYPLVDKKVLLMSFRCPKKCPLLQIPLDQLERADPDLHISLVNIIRKGKGFIPTAEDTFHVGDEISLLAKAEDVETVVRNFGLERKENEQILIFGKDQVVADLAQALEDDDNISGCRIIDEDPLSAKRLAEKLNKTAVFQGSMMSDVVLNEADISWADAVVAATADDKDNIIATLIARKNDVENTIALVNSRSHNTQIINVGDNILIDRTSITISSILKELRKVHINQAYSLGFSGEIWEIVVDNNSRLAGSSLLELGFGDRCKICAIYRKGEFIFSPQKNEKIELGDELIFFVKPDYIRRAEKIFA